MMIREGVKVLEFLRPLSDVIITSSVYTAILGRVHSDILPVVQMGAPEHRTYMYQW